MKQSPSKSGNKTFLRNTFGISSVEFFWGMGLPLLVESTFLQLFMRSLGASNFLIGLLPLFLGFSMPLFSLLSAYISSRLESKRKSVILFHMAAATPIMVFGLYLLIFSPRARILELFLFTYLLFSIAIGFTLPSWQSYIVAIFKPKESMKAISIMFIVQSLAKVFGSFVLYRTVSRYALSVRGAAIVFTLGGAILFSGSLLFLFTREDAEGGELFLPFRGLYDFLRHLRQILLVREFRNFIASDFSYFALVSVLSFYGNYAREFGSVSEALIAGLFVAVSYGGGIISQSLFGWLNILNLRGKMVASKLLAIFGILLLLPGRSLALFLSAAALLGASRALRHLVFPPAVKAIARVRDTTPHFALIAIMEMPFSAGLPLASGLFLDASTAMGAGSYRMLFSFLALLILIGLFFSFRLDFSEDQNGTSARKGSASGT